MIPVFTPKTPYLDRLAKIAKNWRLDTQRMYRELTEKERCWIRRNTVSGEKRNAAIEEMHEYDDSNRTFPTGCWSTREPS